jgi:hypothetical protein
MNPNIVRWLPRVVAMLFTLFISLFAFDVGEGGAVKMMDLLMHLLPTFFCVLIIILAWTHEWIGAVVFLALAAEYAWWAREHVQWILVIVGPLLLLIGSYTAAWIQRKRTTAA